MNKKKRIPSLRALVHLVWDFACHGGQVGEEARDRATCAPRAPLQTPFFHV